MMIKRLIDILGIVMFALGILVGGYLIVDYMFRGPSQSPKPQKAASDISTPSSLSQLEPKALQRDEIGPLARDYLLTHPEILLQMSEKLDAQQQTAVNRTVQTALTTQPELQATLLHDPATPVVHPDGGVTVVQFFDYQCIWCARMAPVVADFVRDNPDVRFVFKEFPIFGSRWPMSVQAARTGLTLWQLKGGDAYLAYHNAVFASGENEGRLSQPTLNAALQAAGAAPMTVLPETEKMLLATRELTQQLNISGTPAFIVMPTRDARAEQVTPLYGAVDVKALQAAIAQAKAGTLQATEQ